MAWYYAQGDERVGPLSDEAFQQLVHQGSITAETLVWREGMQNWAPYGSVAGQTPAGSVPQPHDFSASPMTVCSSCGRTFPSEEVIEYQGSYICAECKPIFFQQLKEGGLVGGAMEYAGFWIRVGAVIIDAIILFVPNMLVSLVINMLAALMNQDSANPLVALLFALQTLLNIAIPMAYETYFIGRNGQTPGKMVCGIKVVLSDGTQISYLRSFGRYFAKMITYLLALIVGLIVGTSIGIAIGAMIGSLTEVGVGFGIGMAAGLLTGSIAYVGVIWMIVNRDTEKRAPHDHICDTRVIRI